MPLCSAVPGRPNPETPVDQSNNIVDISKVGIKQFWNLRTHMQDASTLATAHYPETLDRIFVSFSYIYQAASWDRFRFPPRSSTVRSKPTILADHWRPILFPHRLGLGQKMVWPNHYLQDIHPLRPRRSSHPHSFHRHWKYSQEIWRRPRLWMRHDPCPRPCRAQRVHPRFTGLC